MVAPKPISRNGGTPKKGRSVPHSSAVFETAGSFAADNSAENLLRNGIRRIADKCWRRRYLLIVPVLVMLPLSLAAAFLLPRTFESSTLLLLQESGRLNPLATESVTPEAMQQKVAGLEALLKSEQVLTEAAKAIQAERPALSNSNLTTAIRDLRNALSIELIGTDFLAIRLRGSRSEGLGQELSIVLSSFLEALLSEPRESAAQMVLAKQQREMQAIEQARANLQNKLAMIASQQNDDSRSQLQEQILALEQKLASTRELSDNLTRRYANVSSSPGASILNAPGRIKIVDPPQDPKIATTSRLKFFLSGVAASILLAIALAWGAELFDPTIYNRDELVSAAGLPLLAVLPRPARMPKANVADTRHHIATSWLSVARGWLLPLAIVIVFGGIGYFVASNITLDNGIREWLNWLRWTSTPRAGWLVDPFV